jgi:hypothetical protein
LIGNLVIRMLLNVAEVFSKGSDMIVGLSLLSAFMNSIVTRSLLAGSLDLIQSGVLIVRLSLSSLEVGIESRPSCVALMLGHICK